jgi:hypothetical protein
MLKTIIDFFLIAGVERTHKDLERKRQDWRDLIYKVMQRDPLALGFFGIELIAILDFNNTTNTVHKVEGQQVRLKLCPYDF